MKENHNFGCPVFALQSDLQRFNKIPKWSPNSKFYFHQAFKQLYGSSFVQAAVKEIIWDVDSKHWELIKHYLPKNVEIVQSLWAMYL